MKIMKKTSVSLLFFVFTAMGLLLFNSVFADGGLMIWPQTIHVQQTDQNAIVAWNGTTELLTLSTNLSKPAGSGTATLLHVVPLPSQPGEIKEDAPEVFDKMVTLLNTKIAAMQKRSWGEENFSAGGAGGTTATAPSVEIVMQKNIGAHDVTVVKVNTPDDFSNWIDGFASGKKLASKQISQEFKDGLQKYLQRGINYFVFDVLDLSDQSVAVKPLIYQFDTKYFYFPLLISGISEIADSNANINLYLVFDKNWKLPPQIWQNYGNNYYVDDSGIDIGLTNAELKGISERTAGIFSGDVKVRRFTMSGTLSAINKDLMLFPRLFSSNLKQGMYNDDVKILQQLLINEGFWNSTASVSSYFGPVTKQAVMLFQQKNSEQILKPLGLDAPTGFFGPYTRNYLNNNLFIDEGSGPSTVLCGNGKCDTNETAAGCPADCAVKAQTCGDKCKSQGYLFGQCNDMPSGTGVGPTSDCLNCLCAKANACGNGACESGENATDCWMDCSIEGRQQCLASGGTWGYAQVSCVAEKKSNRLNALKPVDLAGGWMGCDVIIYGAGCVCPEGSFWGSKEEGCLSDKISRCGNEKCDNGETMGICAADCK